MSGLDALALVAGLVAAAGAVAHVSRRWLSHLAAVPLLLAGWAGLLLSVLPERARDHAVILLVLAVAAFGACWFAAPHAWRRASWLLAAGAVVLTLRVPVPTGDGTAMLLGPLYVVIGIGALAVLRQQLVDRSDTVDRGGATRLLDIGVALLLAVAAASMAWSFDHVASARALAFFLVPFALLYVVVRTMARAGTSLRPAAAALIASAAAVAVVGIYQAAAEVVWWNPKVIDANAFRADFRVNSLFWDPNMYGRALVIGLLALVAWLLARRVPRTTAAAAAMSFAVIVAALWNTYSQSSWIALAAALTVVAVLTLPPHPRRWVAGALVVILLVGAPLATRQLAGDDADGRGQVVRTGVALAEERPVVGWGIGAFEPAARARALDRGNARPGLVASHTTPVTVLAELGAVGSAAYLMLLTSAFAAVLARWRRTSSRASAARAGGEDPHATGWPAPPVIWATAALVALVAHSLLYAGFFEDPTLWAALALLASLPADADLDVDDRVPERSKDATPHGDVPRSID